MQERFNVINIIVTDGKITVTIMLVTLNLSSIKLYILLDLIYKTNYVWC